MAVTGQVNSRQKSRCLYRYLYGRCFNLLAPKIDAVLYKLSFLNRCKNGNLEIITMQTMLVCLFLTDGSTDVMAKLLILELTVLYSESIQVVTFGSRRNLPHKDCK